MKWVGILEDLGRVEEGREYHQSKLCVENQNKYKKDILDITSKIKNYRKKKNNNNKNKIKVWGNIEKTETVS